MNHNQLLHSQKKQPLPVPFIVGVGRSGNTLLRLMLDSHPDLAIPPETDFLPDLFLKTELATDQKNQFINIITHHWRWSDCHIDKTLFTNRINELNPFSVSDGIRCFYQSYAQRFDKSRWGDKTPYYLEFMTLIQKFLPEARFIHIIRDGRDATLSTLNLWFGANSIEEGAHIWSQKIKQAREQAKLLNHYLEIRYEDLLLNTEEILRKICDFINLNWNPCLLKYYERTENRIKEVVTDFRLASGDIISSTRRHSIHTLTQKPPDITRINTWKTRMLPEDQELFIKIAGSTLVDLGYDLS